MKNIAILILLIFITAGCEQKEQPKSQYQFPKGPVQTQDNLSLLQDAVLKDPGNVNAWIRLGNTFMDTARYTEAIDAYQKALELDPENVDVRVDMGTCYRRTGRSDRAVEEFRRALEYNPNHLYGHMNLGVVLAYDFNDKESAVKEFEKYLELSPNAPNAAQVRQEIERLKAAQ